MKLTKSADFALRVVIYLAQSKTSSSMPIISEKLGVPYNNLTKIVQALAKASIIQTRQGKFGGIYLMKPASEISLKDIIDIMDGPTQLSECLANPASCQLTCTCQLRSVFNTLQDKMNQLFEAVKIDHLIAGEKKTKIGVIESLQTQNP